MKKNFFLLVLSVIYFSVFAFDINEFAAEAERIGAEAQEFIKNEDYNNAAAAADKLLDMCSQLLKELETKNQDNPMIKNILDGYYRSICTYKCELYFKIGRYDEALINYEELLDICKDEKETLDTANIYNNIGQIFYTKQDYDNALANYEKALEIRQNIEGKQAKTSLIYNNIGAVYSDKGDYEKAMSYFEKALEIGLKTEGKNKTIAPYTSIGGIYYKKNNYEEALNYYEKALGLYLKTGGETPDTAIVYNNIALVYGDKGDYDKALSYYQKALDVYSKMPCPPSVKAKIHNNMGLVYTEKGDYKNAISNYEKAVDMGFKANDSLSVAITYNNIGLIYNAKGEFDKSLENYEKALEIHLRTVGETDYTATIYNNIGQLYFNKENYEKAMSYYEKALDIYITKVGETLGAATTYSNMGGVYLKKGDYDRARINFDRALDIYLTKVGKTTKTAAIYNNIGLVYSDKGDYKTAMSYYNKALEIELKAVGETELVATIYNNIGTLYNYENDYENAMLYYKKSLEINLKTVGDSMPTVKDYNNIAFVYGEKKDYDNAIVNYEKALKICIENVGYVSDAETVCNNIALLYCSKGDMDKAAKYYKKSADIIKSADINYESVSLLAYNSVIISPIPDKAFKQEMLDTCLQKLEEIRLSMASMKTEVMKKSLPLYYYGVHFEAEQNKIALAFEYSESLRSRGYLDQIGTSAAMRLDGVSEADRKRLQELLNQIETSRNIISRQNSTENEKRNSELIFNEEQKLHNAEKELSKLDEKLSKKIPKYAQLRNPRTATVKDAQKWCGKNRAILEYVLWDSSLADSKLEMPAIGSYCIVITEKNINVVPLDTENFDYEQDIEKVLDLSQKGNPIIESGNFEKRLISLYDFLIAPVEKYIEAVEDIVIVPDGELFKLPFDLLKKDSSPTLLGDTYTISFSPSISVSIIADTVKNKSGKNLAIGSAWYDKNLSEKEHSRVFSDEKFADEYLKTAAYPSDLPGSAKEINALKKNAFKNKPFDTITQENATERNIKEMSKKDSLSEYSTILFTGHGEYHSSGEAKSGILFSETCGLFPVDGEDANSDDAIDGRLTASEVAILNLNAETFVLSACQTGLGDVKSGDGFTGLTRAFMVAGCKTVGSSLWSIDDAATSEFMAKVFEKVQKGKMTYSRAYKETKAEFRKIEGWSVPYYWAPFVLWE